MIFCAYIALQQKYSLFYEHYSNDSVLASNWGNEYYCSCIYS